MIHQYKVELQEG